MSSSHVIDLDGKSNGESSNGAVVPLIYIFPKTADEGTIIEHLTLVDETDALTLPKEQWRDTPHGVLPNFKDHVAKNLKPNRTPRRYISLNCYKWVRTFDKNSGVYPYSSKLHKHFVDGRLSLKAYAWTSFSEDGDQALFHVVLPHEANQKPQGLLVKLSKAAILSKKVTLVDVEEPGQPLDPETALRSLQAHLLPWQECHLELSGSLTQGFEIVGTLTLLWNGFQSERGRHDCPGVDKLVVKLAGLTPRYVYDGDALCALEAETSRRLAGCTFAGSLQARAVVRRPYSGKRGYCLLGVRIYGAADTYQEVFVKLTPQQVSDANVAFCDDMHLDPARAMQKHLLADIKCDITLLATPLPQGYELRFQGPLILVPPDKASAQAAPCISLEIAAALEANPSLVQPEKLRPVSFRCPMLRGRPAGLLGGTKSTTCFKRAYALVPDDCAVTWRRQLHAHEADLAGSGMHLRELCGGTADAYDAFNQCVSDGLAPKRAVKLLNLKPLGPADPLPSILTAYWPLGYSEAVSTIFQCRFLFPEDEENGRKYDRLHRMLDEAPQVQSRSTMSLPESVLPLHLNMNEEAVATKKEGMKLADLQQQRRQWSERLQPRKGKHHRSSKAPSSRIPVKGRDNWKAASRGSKSSGYGKHRPSRPAVQSKPFAASCRPVVPTMPPPPAWPSNGAGDAPKLRSCVALADLPANFRELRYSMTPGVAWASQLRRRLLQPKIDGSQLEARIFDSPVVEAILCHCGSAYNWPGVLMELAKIYSAVNAELPPGLQEPPSSLTFDDLTLVFGNGFGNKFKYPFYADGDKKRALANFSFVDVVNIYAGLTFMKMTYPHVEHYRFIVKILEANGAYMNSLTPDAFDNYHPLSIDEVIVAELKRYSLADRRSSDTTAFVAERCLFSMVLKTAMRPGFLGTWCHCEETPKVSAAVACSWALQILDCGQHVDVVVLAKCLRMIGSCSQSSRDYAKAMLEGSQFARGDATLTGLHDELSAPYLGVNSDTWAADMSLYPLRRDFSYLMQVA